MISVSLFHHLIFPPSINTTSVNHATKIKMRNPQPIKINSQANMKAASSQVASDIIFHKRRQRTLRRPLLMSTSFELFEISNELFAPDNNRGF